MVRATGFSRVSLRWRLLLLLGLVASLLVSDRAREILDRRAELIEDARQKLADHARGAAQRQADVVSDLRALLTLAAAIPESGIDAGQRCRAPYQTVVSALPWLLSLVNAAPNGSTICASSERFVGLQLGDRAYFKRALATRDFVLSDYLITRGSKEPAIVAAMPRIVDREVESVVVARIDLAGLNRLAPGTAPHFGFEVTLSDAAGTVLAAVPSAAASIGRTLAALNLPDLPGSPNPQVVDTVGAGGEGWIHAVIGLPQTGSRVHFSARRAAILAPADRETMLSALKLGLVFLACAGVIWIGTERVLVRPVEDLARVTARFGEGDLAARAEEAGLAPEIRDLAGRLVERENELRAINEQLAVLATVDGLTGLPNRRLFDERLVQEWRRAGRTGKPIGAVVVDVDCFKAYNDTYGHPEGDACLRRIARIIGSERRVDDLAARLGGEEFVILLPGADAHRTAHVARLLRLEIQAMAIPHAKNPAGIVTISAGAASVRPASGGSAGDLIRAADEALYRAKREGRNRIAVAEAADIAESGSVSPLSMSVRAI